MPRPCRESTAHSQLTHGTSRAHCPQLGDENEQRQSSTAPPSLVPATLISWRLHSARRKILRCIQQDPEPGAYLPSAAITRRPSCFKLVHSRRCTELPSARWQSQALLPAAVLTRRANTFQVTLAQKREWSQGGGRLGLALGAERSTTAPSLPKAARASAAAQEALTQRGALGAKPEGCNCTNLRTGAEAPARLTGEASTKQTRRRHTHTGGLGGPTFLWLNRRVRDVARWHAKVARPTSREE